MNKDLTQLKIKTDQELRIWAIEQSIKWRTVTKRTKCSSGKVAEEYYNFAAAKSDKIDI